MDDPRRMLGIIALCLGAALLLWQMVLVARDKRRHRRLARMSADQLRDLARRQPFIYCFPALRELTRRKEDIDFALPMLLEMASGKDRAAQMFASSALREHFPDRLAGTAPSPPNPLERDRDTPQAGDTPTEDL